MSTPLEAWSSLSPPWQACVEEAWTSWRRGSAGVGCAITDATGEIVARGGNRMMEPKSVPHELAGTPLAHAETVTLATLGLGHFGKVFVTKKDAADGLSIEDVRYAPYAMMNAVYAGGRKELVGSDNSSFCSIWAGY